MKRLAIAAVGLALVVGIVVGGMVGNPFGRSAPASAAGQAREDQITIVSQGSRSDSGAWAKEPSYSPLDSANPIILALDPSDYSPSSTFRFEGVWHQITSVEGGTGCFRLFDQTASAPVSDSEVCYTRPNSGTDDVRVRSSAFLLPSGEHEYTLEGQCISCGAYLAAARVIVEWTEPMAVGGIAELPPLASAPGGSGMGGATYAVLAGAAAGVLAFAVLATLSVKRRRVR